MPRHGRPNSASVRGIQSHRRATRSRCTMPRHNRRDAAAWTTKQSLILMRDVLAFKVDQTSLAFKVYNAAAWTTKEGLILKRDVPAFSRYTMPRQTGSRTAI